MQWKADATAGREGKGHFRMSQAMSATKLGPCPLDEGMLRHAFTPCIHPPPALILLDSTLLILSSQRKGCTPNMCLGAHMVPWPSSRPCSHGWMYSAASAFTPPRSCSCMKATHRVSGMGRAVDHGAGPCLALALACCPAAHHHGGILPQHTDPSLLTNDRRRGRGRARQAGGFCAQLPHEFLRS